MTNSQLLKSLDRYPPFLVRALARKVGNAVQYRSTEELAALLGWSVERTRDVAKRITWAKMRVEDADHFASACGTNLHRLELISRRLKIQLRAERPFQAHLSVKQINVLMRRLEKWRAYRKAKGWK